MILNRLGNKKAIATEIQKYFPKHDVYIEPFFGAGGMFFNKPKAKYNIVNDLDSDVYNLYRQLIDNKEELVKWIELTPITEKQFKEWGKGKREKTDLLNAVRFLILSNFGFYGLYNSISVGAFNTKQIIINNIESTFSLIKDVTFLNSDFRNIFNKIKNKESKLNTTFCYCDPPYLGTDDNYSNSFTKQDCIDLFDCLQASGLKFAISEFNNPFIIEQAKQRGLNVNYVCERQSIKNRNIEVLITNYDLQHLKLF